jgi:hypothetical protein
MARAAGSWIVMLALAALVPLAGQAVAADVRVVVRSGDVKKPAQWSTEYESIFDETIFRARSLRWRTWGGPTASARGTLVHCVTEYHACHRYRGRLQFRRPVSYGNCAGVPYLFYSQFRVTSHGGFTAWYRFPSCT